MLFWIKNIVFAAILIALAVYLIANEEELFGTSSTDLLTGAEEEPAKTEQPKYSKPSLSDKQSNAAAEGLSRFYANLRGSDDPSDGPRVRNNIVYLPDPSGDLEEILEAKRKMVRPLLKNWRSEVENRPFRPPDTLHQKLLAYAEDEGLDVIWWLNRDFLIKDPFRVNKDIIDTAYQLGQAIEGHFQNGLSVYFCYQHRSIVLIDRVMSYLDENCTKLPRNNRGRDY
ncbi:TcpQ domain-containing protein [Thalassotalea marina]|uniref:Toxin co-regulated pilus biosynthesis protein Q C-terminal domain-containing protein n=1 Tax=Thalassotalea marina TaxID=1673741 RepID=A0A919BE28_9GAMM|nr:TcpQ domain-containing protein [Thalassotalea marina]GHF85214.1 hypothetical protein GCM10017161_10950 [Thalassotalea marina]